MKIYSKRNSSHGDRYLGMTAAMTQAPVPTAMRVMRSELVTEVSHRGQAILLFGQFDGEAAALVIVSIED